MLSSLLIVLDTLLFSYILYLQLVEGKATSRYLGLTPQFYSDLLQTLLSRVFNSLEWGLNSPPKAHAFVSLPVQSSFFSIPPRFIKIIKDNLNETSFYTVFLVLFTLIAYKLTTKFMLSELDLVLYFPLFSTAYSLLCAICICHVRNKELTNFRFAFIVFFGLSVPLMIYLFSGYYNELHVYICSALALVSGMAISSEGPVVIEIWKKLTLYKNGSSNTSGPPASSGNRAAGSGSGSGSGQGTGSSSVPEESRANVPGFRQLLTNTYNATVYGTRPSHGPASGSVAPATPPSGLCNGEMFDSNNKSSSELNNIFGPNPNPEQIESISDKIRRQMRDRVYAAEKSIYGKHPVDQTLSLEDRTAIARKFAGLNEGYYVENRGSRIRPDFRVTIRGSNGKFEPIKDTTETLEKLNR